MLVLVPFFGLALFSFFLPPPDWTKPEVDQNERKWPRTVQRPSTQVNNDDEEEEDDG